MNLQNLAESPNIIDMTGFPVTNQEFVAQIRQFAYTENMDAVEVSLWFIVGMWVTFVIIMILWAFIDLYFTHERLSRWHDKLQGWLSHEK